MPKTDGGARYSDHINRRVTQAIFRAFDFAADRGTPLNTSVTVNLRESTEAAAATIFTKVRHKFRDWHSRLTKRDTGKPVPPLYVYALEHPGDMPHAHWVVHIPQAYAAEFAMKLPRWVEKAQGQCGKFDVKLEPVTLTHAKVLAKYVVKGTDPEFVSYFHLQKFDNVQGRIWGKRASVSAALGKAARASEGFRPQPPGQRRKQFFPKRQAAPSRRQEGEHWRPQLAGSATSSARSREPPTDYLGLPATLIPPCHRTREHRQKWVARSRPQHRPPRQ